MGTTARGFRYPSYTDSPDIPGAFFNLASDLNSAFDASYAYTDQKKAEAQSYADGLKVQTQNYSDSQLGSVRSDLQGQINGKYSSSNVTIGSWAPQLGGSGASIGANAAYEGSYLVVGNEAIIRGRIIFGSSASFGGGTATITGLPKSLRTITATGHGHFITADGATYVGIFFTAADGTNMTIRRIKNDGNLGLGYDLGTPGQSSQMVFTFHGALA